MLDLQQNAKGGRNFRVVSHPLSRGLTFILFTFISVFLLPLVLRLFPFYHFASVGVILPISKFLVSDPDHQVYRTCSLWTGAGARCH